MRLDSLEIVRVAMPLIAPFRTAYGDDWKIESVLVRMKSAEYSGWGEATPLAFFAYSPESARTLFVVARDFIAPLLLGKVIESGVELQTLLSHIKGKFSPKPLSIWCGGICIRANCNNLCDEYSAGKIPIVETGADFGAAGIWNWCEKCAPCFLK